MSFFNRPDKYFLALVWFFILSGAAAAPASENRFFAPFIRNFSKQDYQAYNQNWSLCQDTTTGFLYAGNSKGLLEFDGTRWKLYRLPRQAIVRAIAVDQRGKIFTGGLGEIGYWQANRTGELQYHSLTTLIRSKRFAKEEIWNIVVGPDFVFFQSFSTAFLYRLGRMEELHLPGNVLFLYAVKNRYYLQAIGSGLYEMIHGKFVPLPGTASLATTAVHAILPLGSDGLLIGTHDHGLFSYRNGRLARFQHAASQLLQRYQCNKGLALPDGRYAFGTILNGIVVTDTTGAILYSANQREGLQNNTVLSLTLDQRENLWAGLDDGIDAISFSYPLKYYSDPNGQLGTPYDAVLYHNKLYLGTNHGVYWSDFLPSGMPVYHLVEGSQGQVWDLTVLDDQLLCGHNSGTYRIAADGGWERLSQQAGGWRLHPLASRPGLALQGTYTGLCVYQRDGNGRWQFSHTVSGFNEPIREIWEDSAGQIWLRHAHNGVYAVKLSPDLRKVSGLKWAPTYPKDEQLKRNFRISGGIRRVFAGWKNELLFLRQDGNLLVARPDGLKAEFAVSNFSWMDDYENIVPLDSAYYLLCFEKGYALLPRQEILTVSNRQLTTKPLIRQLAVVSGSEQRFFTFRDAAALLSTSPILDAEENHLVLQFSLPESIQEPLFSYRLVGLDDHWSDFSRVAEKDYASLPPGRYSFQVRSSTDGTFTALPFEILPPWYQSPWAYWSYFLLLCGTVGLSFYVHRRQVSAHQLKVRQQMEEKLAREQERHRQQMIQLQKEKLEQDVIGKAEELANTTMNLIHKNDLLIKLKDEVEKLKDEVQQRQAIDRATGHINQLIKLIDSNLSSRQDWKVFEKNFNKVHEQFFKQLLSQYSGLTPDDLRLAAYLRMNLSSKEVAKLLNITVRGVELKRYRLRKRLNLEPEANLNEFMMAF
ncbi:triple tyrosine motif-containing protein [Larkinella insperata]|uniref:Triple tyrosine motif-containing protein n=1 Tax=Larkinella insperata TaxID=332158 RepID=A0ABW3QE63_9BACT|nr:triple tyrosine motif-containing protein [Larkinella insperata]